MGSTDVNQQMKEIKDPNSSFDKLKMKNPALWMQAKHRLDVDEVVFKVYKGVKCFHFCKKSNVLATGGRTIGPFMCLAVWRIYSHTCIETTVSHIKTYMYEYIILTSCV